MSEVIDKFIGYLDIVGFESIEAEAEAGRGLTLSELSELISCLGTANDQRELELYGPTLCPQAPHIRKDLDFRITQVSDCVIVSAEVSPAGVINLLGHCERASMKLLKKGVVAILSAALSVIQRIANSVVALARRLRKKSRFRFLNRMPMSEELLSLRSMRMS